jgi:hypothetical protein
MANNFAVKDAAAASTTIKSTDTAGVHVTHHNIDVIAAGDNNIGNVDIASALPAGTNAIGKLAANSGVDIGDVDILSIAAGTNTIGGTRDAGPAWTSAYQHTASADASGGADLTAAPTAGQKICIDDVVISVGAALTVTLEEETSGTDLMLFYMAANSTIQITPRGKWKLPTADKKLRLDTSGAGNIAVMVTYHSEA